MRRSAHSTVDRAVTGRKADDCNGSTGDFQWESRLAGGASQVVWRPSGLDSSLITAAEPFGWCNEIRPSLHQWPTLLQQVRAVVGGLDLILDGVG